MQQDSDSKDLSLSTRERRKARLRNTIRQEAFKLFAKQGYDQTTVEQIADAADVSYSTFFRCFPSKNAVAFDFLFDELFVEALASQPAEMPLTTAVNTAIAKMTASLSEPEISELHEYHQLLQRVPELQAAAFHNLNVTAGRIAEIIARRLKKPADTLAIQTFAWSIVGAWIAGFHYWVGHPKAKLTATLNRALRQIESGAALLDNNL